MRPGLPSLLPALLLLLSACGQEEQRAAPGTPVGPPAWVLTPPREPGRLFGVGGAPIGQREHAIDAAKGDIIKQISVSISVEDSTREVSTDERATGQERLERYESEARSQARQRSSMRDLPGLEVVKQEDAGDTTYVLATFDRSLWAADLRQRLADLDDRMVAAAKGSGGSELAEAGTLLKTLLPLFAERDELAGRLRLAEPGVQVAAPPVDRFQARRRIAIALQKLSFELPVGDEFRAMAPQLVESFTRQGIRAVPAGTGQVAQGEVRLRLKLTRQASVRVVDGWHIADGAVSGLVEDQRNGRQVGGVKVSERASARSETEARDRLTERLCLRLVETLDKQLVTFLSGL